MGAMVVYPKHMGKNLSLSLRIWNSQTLLLALIRKGLKREDACVLVQRNAMKTLEVIHVDRDDADFVKRLQSDPEVARHLKKSKLETLCALELHFKEVKNQFKNLGFS
jgi:adenylosuccinate lyase